jgi:polyisoprenoid-binding protein YceI
VDDHHDVPRKLWIPIAAAMAFVLLGAGGAYAYFFSGLRSTPSALTLPSPSPSETATASTSPSAIGAGTGTWTIASGSIAGYRVHEQFAGQSATHEAVARTSAVTGSVSIAQSGGSYTMTSAKITVGLSGLASVDSVAGFNVTNRDRIVQQALDVGSFPTAVFESSDLALPADAARGQTVTVSVPGRLTIHGVTRAVTAKLQLRVSGSSAQIAATIATSMEDFGVSRPTAPFVTVQPGVTIEVALKLARSS